MNTSEHTIFYATSVAYPRQHFSHGTFGMYTWHNCALWCALHYVTCCTQLSCLVLKIWTTLCSRCVSVSLACSSEHNHHAGTTMNWCIVASLKQELKSDFVEKLLSELSHSSYHLTGPQVQKVSAFSYLIKLSRLQNCFKFNMVLCQSNMLRTAPCHCLRNSNLTHVQLTWLAANCFVLCPSETVFIYNMYKQLRSKHIHKSQPVTEHWKELE